MNLPDCSSISIIGLCLLSHQIHITGDYLTRFSLCKYFVYGQPYNIDTILISKYLVKNIVKLDCLDIMHHRYINIYAFSGCVIYKKGRNISLSHHSFVE